MATYQSIIAYDGTEFAGFQKQARRRTVQGDVERALRHLGWKERSLRAAGRTDTGVHARGQVVAFDVAWRRSEDELTAALNAHLPSDVAVRETRLAPPGFHPRFAATGRRYSYSVVFSPTREPLVERFAWRVWPPPPMDAVRQASRMLVGDHDFRAFGPSPRPGGTTRRTVRASDWTGGEAAWVFWIEADAFLYRMVRRIVAALMAVGRGELGSERLAALVEDPSLRWQGAIAPAQGLCLEQVMFETKSAVSTREDGAGRR
jgi:tRNA pseudouridine38-40 synthase